MAADPRKPSPQPSPLVESPSADEMEGAPGPTHDPAEDGQLGPDELPDPNEVTANRDAKLHQKDPARS